MEEEPKPVKISDWDALIGLIRNTPEGSEFIYDAGYRTWIPRTVIKVAQDRNITLIIKWRGGPDITVKPTDDIDLTLWQIFLKDLL